MRVIVYHIFTDFRNSTLDFFTDFRNLLDTYSLSSRSLPHACTEVLFDEPHLPDVVLLLEIRHVVRSVHVDDIELSVERIEVFALKESVEYGTSTDPSRPA